MVFKQKWEIKNTKKFKIVVILRYREEEAEVAIFHNTINLMISIKNMNLKVITWMKTLNQTKDHLLHTNTSHTTKTIIKTSTTKTIMTLLEAEVEEDSLRIIEAATVVDTTIITTKTKVTDNFCTHNLKWFQKFKTLISVNNITMTGQTL